MAQHFRRICIQIPAGQHLVWGTPRHLSSSLLAHSSIRSCRKNQQRSPLCSVLSASLHTSSPSRKYLDPRDEDTDDREHQLTVQQGEIFQQVATARKVKNSATFKLAIAKFAAKDPVYRRGHVEFIYASTQCMKEFNVEKDLSAYKLIMDLFPKNKMIAKSMWQVEMMHYPKQQQCCIDLLDFMEVNGVIPDDAMGNQLVEIFGKRTHAFRKYQRMMYWMPKFKYSNPYYVPHQLPNDPTELARMALKRMSVDLQNEIQVYQSNELGSSMDHTFIVSAQSPGQRDLLLEHPSDKPVLVEGGFSTWLRGQNLMYFILRSETTDNYNRFQEADKDEDDTKFNWNIFEQERPPSSVAIPPSVHEQSDGTILAMCITGTASKDSLASWVKFLERDSPRLSQVPVVFLLRTPEAGIQVWNDKTRDEDKGMSAL